MESHPSHHPASDAPHASATPYNLKMPTSRRDSQCHRALARTMMLRNIIVNLIVKLLLLHTLQFNRTSSVRLFPGLAAT
jgi:hypothetical protein